MPKMVFWEGMFSVMRIKSNSVFTWVYRVPNKLGRPKTSQQLFIFPRDMMEK